MLFLYAITDQPASCLDHLTGLDDVPLRSLAHRDIAAIVSETETAQPAPEQVALWQFEAALEGVMAARTVLPVRFGTVFSSEAAVQQVLTTYYADFGQNLAAVRGRVEVGVRVLYDEDEAAPQPTAPAPTNNGRDYMLARLAAEKQAQSQRQHAAAMADTLHAPLGKLAVDSQCEVLPSPKMVLCGTYLIEAGQLEPFKAAIAALSAEYPQMAFLCTGPWPPFSFVTVSTLASEV